MGIAIRVRDLHKSYGDQVILDGAEADIRDDHRLAVIGRNGAGKSTLCRIILGQEEADRGSIDLGRGTSVAYLEQHDSFEDGESVQGFLERFSGKEGWRCAELAGRFQMGPDRLAMPVRALSGGYQTRAKLCGMLLCEPTFLILDEPTNYLDTATQLLLERFLTSFKGGFLVVSHDREFLNRTCTGTMEVARGGIEIHEGTVDHWLTEKEVRRGDAQKFNANQETKRKALEEFVARNKARASTAARAQSKQKQLDQLEYREVVNDDTAPVIRLPPVQSRPGPALLVDGLAIGYPDRRVAAGIRLEIERARKVGIIGENGQGKTTLLRTLVGDLTALGGTVKWGYAIRLGVYAQHVYGSMDGRRTVRDHVMAAAKQSPRAWKDQELLDLAGTFLFRGDAVDKRVEVLSGGERSRLCLCTLLIGGFEALLLDEPTNHLDVETVEALIAALKQHNGTVFFISHDRSFVSRLADVIIEVKDGGALVVPEGYDAWLYRLRQAQSSEQPATARKTKPAAPERTPGTTDLRQAERAVSTLEAERDRLIGRLAAGFSTTDQQALARVKEQLAAAEEAYFRLGSMNG
jgi:ATP-binding cassette, subfamily F, member 3